MSAASVAVPGSRADLAQRAGQRPIYLTAQFDLRRSALDAVLDHLRREMPAAKIIAARGLYDDIADWESRWPAERKIYGAAIVVTDLPAGSGPIGGAAAIVHTGLPTASNEIAADKLHVLPFHGGHEIPGPIATEIATFSEMRKPVAWVGLEFPRLRWCSRFAVETKAPSGVWFRLDAAGFLYPAIDAAHFSPVISPRVHALAVAKFGPARAGRWGA